MIDKAQDVCRVFDQMVSARANHEQIWIRLSEVLRPLRKHFSSNQPQPGERRHEKVYHSGPIHSLSNFKAGLYGRMTNPATDWFEIRIAGDEDLNDRTAVREWREEVTRLLRLTFTPAMSAFYNQAPAVYADIGAFGTGVMYTAEIPGQSRFYDAAISLEETYIAANQWNEVDTVARKFYLTAKQAKEKFPTGLSAQIEKAAENTPLTRFEFIHMVRPNPDYVAGAIGQKGFDYESIYLEREGKNILREEGFYTMPFHVPRWDIAAGEVYGRGQGELALADILSLNAARKSNMTMANRQADPTLLAQDELQTKGVRAFPGSMIYGGISADGRKLIQPLDEGKNLNIAMEYENILNDAVKDAFFFSLMQIQGSTDMTATEFLGREEESMRLLGPHVGQIESDFLTPLIKRRFDILDSAFQIPLPPEEISDQPLEIQYVSPLARLQKVERASAAVRAANGLMLGAQLDPGVADRFSGDDFADIMEDGLGSGILVSREEAEERRAARQQQQQNMMLMENAPGLARAAKDAKEAVKA